MSAATSEVDAIVVGGGPAGLAAALWLARYRRSVLVVDAAQYRAAAVRRSHGYLGRDPQRPTELIDRGRRELLAYPTATYQRGIVTGAVRRADGLFELCLDEAQQVLAQRIVLATGVVDTLPSVAGIEEHYGASAFHCPSCDGYEAREHDVVALGWEAHLVGFATTLLNWASSVTVLTNGHRLAADETTRELLAEHHVDVIEERVAGLVGSRGDLQAVRLSDGTQRPCSLIFFSVAHQPQNALARMLGAPLTAEGCITVDEQGQTTVPGLYAAGDVVPGLQLIQVAASEGAIAGIGCAQSLAGAAGSPTSPPPEPDIDAELAERR